MRAHARLGLFALLCVAPPIAAACVGDDPSTQPTAPGTDGGGGQTNPDGSTASDGSNINDAAAADADAAVVDRVVEVSAGGRSSCALYASGNVYCWGDNSFGELGIGLAGADHVQPTKLPFTRPVIRMSMGTYTGCVVENDNSLWCWGDNQFGDIGEAVDASSTCGARHCEISPVLVPNVKVKDVALGFHFGCAIAVDSHVYCWGQNGFSQAAADQNTTTIDPPLLVPVGELSNITKMQFGYGGHTACALDTAGAMWCWGANTLGQLAHTPGAGSPADIMQSNNAYSNKTPEKISLPNNAKVVDLAAADSICAVTDDGSVYCWGRNTGNELLLGGPDSNVHAVPTKITSISGATAISGTSAYCVLKGSSQPLCWGPSPLSPGPSNAPGCTTNAENPAICHDVGVVAGPLFASISVNDLHAVGLSSAGVVVSWGDDTYGRVNVGDAGVNALNFVSIPAPVLGLP